MISIVSMVGIRVAIVSMVGISMAIVSMSIAIGSISSGLGISRPLAIEVAIVVGIWVCIVSIGMGIAMVSIAKVSIAMVSIVSISSGLRLGISRSLAIVVSMVPVWVTISMVSMMAIAKVVAIAIVAIEDTSISTCFSFTSNSGEHAQGNNSNGFHHFQCLQARGFS